MSEAARTLSMLADQWSLTHIQLVNWGTFCGYHDLVLTDGDGEAARVVMITGESGTGKSTLFDAKTAVMMRGTTRFNSASNQTAGRARGSRERNLLSYVLGKQDDEYDPTTGETRESYLRSTETSNWSAIALTYRSSTGDTFCACRLYYALAHSATTPDAWYLTAAEELDPRAMAGHAHSKFNRAALRAAYPDAKVYDGPEAFLRATYRHLGIGRDGEGDSAMKLHERIQAGTSITNVDALFKDLVIDEPSTYEKAADACSSFEEHEATWVEMDRARRKMTELAGIRQAHEALEEAETESQLLASCNPGADGPEALWAARRQSQVLGTFAQECAARVQDLDARIAQTSEQISREQEVLDRLKEEVSGRGGGAIDQLEREAELLGDRAAEARMARARLQEHLSDIGLDTPATSEDFTTLLEQAQAFLDGYERQRERLDRERLDAALLERQLADRTQELGQQLAFYRNNPVNITPRMARDRQLISRATGIPERDLPYAAELMDLAEGEEEWRVAANVGFHGIATLMLVDQRRLRDFSVRVNGLSLDHRVGFEGVRLRPWHAPRTARGRLSSKLVFREESPFSAWVAERLSDSTQDYSCVERPEDLGGRGQQITREGQTRRRTRGAHGHSRDSLIIGFTNERRIGELEEELELARQELSEAQAQEQAAAAHLDAQGRRRDAARLILSLRWEAIDDATLERQLADIRQRIRHLKEDASLARLMAERDELQERLNGLNQDLGATKSEREQEQVQCQGARAAADEAATRAARLSAGGIAVSPEQERVIGELAERAERPYRSDGDSLGELARAYSRVEAGHARNRVETALVRSMRERMRSSSQQARQQEELLTSIFAAYHERWLDADDPTGTGVESYPDYLRMLEELESDQLDLHIEDWLVDTLRHTGAALAPLARAYTTDLQEIRRRMRPINAIMSGFSFGPDHGQLEIVVADREPKLIRDFRRELGHWAELATAESIEDADQLHRRLRAFMERLGEAAQQHDSGPLNTKRLVYITVVAHYDGRPELADKAYSTLGAKSGGETQELIAFILGAALLFCLGDNGQAKPTFAPVFLDEAFIKADERFTRRAIEALVGLGFQVIIAVPTSKVQAVEPVAQEYVCITKNPLDSHSFIERMVKASDDA